MYKGKKIICLLYARINSTRLKKKLLKKIGNKTILEICIESAQKINLVDEVYLLTTKHKNNNDIIKICHKKKIECYQGSENNLIKRTKDFLNINKINYNILVRYCCDNPLTINNYIEKGIKKIVNNNYDLISCAEFSNQIPGISQIIFTKKTFDTISKLGKEKKHKEHIENFCYENPSLFRIFYAPIKKNDFIQNLSLSIDTIEDYKNVKKFSEIYKKNKTILNLGLLKNNIDKLKINLSNEIFKDVRNLKNKYNNFKIKSYLFFSKNFENKNNNIYYKISNNNLEIYYFKNNIHYKIITKKIKNVEEGYFIFINLIFTIIRLIKFNYYIKTIDLDNNIKSVKIISKFLPIKKELNRYFPDKVISDKKIKNLGSIKNNLISKKLINYNLSNINHMYVYDDYFCVPMKNKLNKISKFNSYNISEIWQSFYYSNFKTMKVNQQLLNHD
jgi:spore coat polysaccharide biosynthesis protein SpsF